MDMHLHYKHKVRSLSIIGLVFEQNTCRSHAFVVLQSRAINSSGDSEDGGDDRDGDACVSEESPKPGTGQAEPVPVLD